MTYATGIGLSPDIGPYTELSSNYVIGTPKLSAYSGFDANYTVDLPDSYAAGETVILVVGKNQTADDWTDPSGWTVFNAGTTSARIKVYVKTMTGSEGTSVTITTPSQGRWLGLGFRFDADSTANVSAGSTQTNTATKASASVTTTVANTRLLRAAFVRPASTSGHSTDDLTQPEVLVAKSYGYTSPNENLLAASVALQELIGATSTDGWTFPTSGTNWATLTIAFPEMPAASGATPPFVLITMTG